MMVIDCGLRMIGEDVVEKGKPSTFKDLNCQSFCRLGYVSRGGVIFFFEPFYCMSKVLKNKAYLLCFSI